MLNLNVALHLFIVCEEVRLLLHPPVNEQQLLHDRVGGCGVVGGGGEALSHQCMCMWVCCCSEQRGI